MKIMNKYLLFIVMSLMLTSCVDQNKRQKYLQSVYPKCKVEPATGIIQHSGYEFIVIDSTNQIIAVNFYPFSETKISSLRNIR
jgi:hypothetical protein